MDAGPEVDAWVAVAIMGWRLAYHNGWRGPDDGWTGYVAAPAEDCAVWAPSTDIATAWQVVERLQRTLDKEAWAGFAWRMESEDLLGCTAMEAARLICEHALAVSRPPSPRRRNASGDPE